MALVNCSDCGKQISSKHQICPHCGFDFNDQDPLQAERRARKRKRNFIARIEMGAYTAIALVTGGSLWYWKDTNGLVDPPNTGPLMTLAAGTLLFVGLRLYALIYNMKARKEKKKE
ncbi:MAG: hypothetical protein ACWA5R_13835 [bacterium]